MNREDYLDPNCALCGKPGEPETIQPVPIGRILEKLNQYEQVNDTAGMERHLLYWMAEAELGRDERGQLTLSNELMGRYRMSGNREKALLYSQQALELVEKLGLEETVTAGTTYLNSGTVREAFGEAAEALSFFEQARSNYERNLPETDPRLGGLYNNMALCLTALGRYEDAEILFYQALRVMERQPAGELEQAITWLNLADAAEAKLGPEAAEAEVEPCLTRAEQLLNTESLPRNGYYAFVCQKCAPVFGHYGWFAEEAELRRRVKAIYEKR